MAKSTNVRLFENCCAKPDRLKTHFEVVFSRLDVARESDIYTTVGTTKYHKVHIMQDINDIMRVIRSKWYCMQQILLNDNTSMTTNILYREYINEGFQAICLALLLSDHSSNKNKYVEDILKCLKVFLSSVIPISKINEVVISKLTSSTNENCPYYQYFHTYLEISYYVTVLFFLCGVNTENMESYLETVMENLSLITQSSSKKCANFTSIKTCTCMNYFWLALQLVNEKLDSTGSLFWRVFNKVIGKQTSLYALGFLSYMASIQSYNINFENEGTKCARIKPNYHFLEIKMKELLSSSNCDTIVCGLKFVEPLLCNLWLKEGKIDILQFIWDFYSKRLNISNKSTANISAFQFIEIFDQIVTSPTECKEDFEIFLGFLLFHLKEYPLQWVKMKGRIYSQLGPNKIKELSEIGIRHVMLLFLVLSGVSFKELEKKMLAFVENLPQEKKYSLAFWNLYSAIILKYVREGRSIEALAPQMLNMLQEAVGNQKMFYLIKEFIKNFELIILNSLNMNLQQCLLLGSWLGKYQAQCYFADLATPLELLSLLVEKCSDPDCWPHWENAIKDNVYVNMKHLSSVHNSPAIIGKIAGKIALLCPTLTNDAFTFFNSESISSNVSSKFLEVILEHYPDQFILTSQQENLIVESWVKICFLTVDLQSELSRNVMKLDIFPPEMKNCIRSATDPMLTFIEYLGNHSQQTFDRSMNLLKICEIAFNNLNKFLGQYVVKPENKEVVLKIYRYASFAFLKCSNLIYNRNKSVTVLTKLVEALLLPMDLMVGKRTLHPFVLNAIKNTWGIFFKAFMNLNPSNDPYIDRTLKELIVKFIPHYSTADSPIVLCLKNLDCTPMILEKMYVAYFKPSTKETDANVLKALKIIADLINDADSGEYLKLIVRKSLRGLFEIVIFHTQRSTAIGVIKNLTSSPLFNCVREDFKEIVLAISDKNMALNTINYFQLMICLAKFASREIKDLMEQIERQVVNVERLRGVGFDKTLRTHLEKLENALKDNL